MENAKIQYVTQPQTIQDLEAGLMGGILVLNQKEMISNTERFGSLAWNA